MTAGTVRTVLGDIPAAKLGVCYAHEHIIIDRSYATERHPKLLLDSTAHAIAELADVHRAGGRAVVDTMPCGAGRNVRKLVEISRGSGVHIIAPTGLHLPKYYPHGHWRERLSVTEMTELFVGEIESGIDAADCAGPTVARTPHRAGIIKVASAGRDIDAKVRTLFEAAAAAHRHTGAPIITHVESGRGFEQIAFLRARGVDSRHILLSHTDRLPDLDYHRALLGTGVRLEYDRAFRYPLDAQHPTLLLAPTLLREFPEQILFGTDGAKSVWWRSYGGGPGLDFLLTTFSQALTGAGVDPAEWQRAFVTNPAALLAFRT